MHPKTTRLQNTQHNRNQRATAMRKYTSSNRAPTQVSMTTEYQDRFLPPSCHMTVVSTTTQKKPYHSLKGTSVDITTFRSYYLTHKKYPPKVQRRCSSTQHNPAGFLVNELASKVDDYTSVYKNDFQAWDAKKRQPCRLSNSSKVHQGPAVSDFPSKKDHSQKDPAQVEVNSHSVPQKKKERQSFEGLTSYRSDYVTHSLPPRTHKETNKGLPLDSTAASFRPKVAWNINQELVGGASEFFKDFNNWSLETKFHGQRKAQVCSAPADHTFLSTTHAHYITHKCQRTKPILPVINTEKSKEPFQAMTTMREDYKAWGTPPHVPVRTEETEQKKSPLSVWGPTPAESCKTNLKPCNFNSKTNETTVRNPSCNLTEKPQRPAENQAFSGFHCISSGNGETRTYWSTRVDRGVTWPDDDNCEEPSQTCQTISCRVSGKN